MIKEGKKEIVVQLDDFTHEKHGLRTKYPRDLDTN
jgi:hypothetical protein